MSIDLDQLEAAAKRMEEVELPNNLSAIETYMTLTEPDTVLELIAEIRKLRAELEYVRELHAEVSAALRNKELDAMLADNELMEFMQRRL